RGSRRTRGEAPRPRRGAPRPSARSGCGRAPRTPHGPRARAPASPPPARQLPAPPCSSRPSLEMECQIVPVDHLIPATIAQDRLDVVRAAAGDRAALVGGVADDAAAELRAVRGEHAHRVAALELAVDLDDSGGQQAPPGSERALGAGVDAN